MGGFREILKFSWSERKTLHITSISGGKSCLMLVYKLMNHTCLSLKFTYYNFGPYQVSCLNPLPPSLFVRQDTRAKDHHNSLFLRLMIVFYDCHWRGLRKTGASYFFDGNEFWILLCFRGKHTENFNLDIHLAFLSMYHHPIFKRYILSNYPEFYRITLFLET